MTILHRPVGPEELELIAASGYRGFPPRLPGQPIDELLKAVNSHGVHLSAETRVTLQVGVRHGKPVLLSIRAGDMHRAGFVFRCSANGVWLVDHVPPQFIEFPTAEN